MQKESKEKVNQGGENEATTDRMETNVVLGARYFKA